MKDLKGDALFKMFVGALFVLLLGAAVFGAEKVRKPELVLIPHPRMPMAHNTFEVWAELKGGDEVEELYCPEAAWTIGKEPDDIHSTQEGDCAAFDERRYFPRRWCLGECNGHPLGASEPGLYYFRLELKKGGRVVARQDLEVEVH